MADNKHAKKAARALSDLNMFYAIIALAEYSLISSSRYSACQRIVKVCKSESARCLNDYDKGMAALAKEKPNGR